MDGRQIDMREAIRMARALRKSGRLTEEEKTRIMELLERFLEAQQEQLEATENHADSLENIVNLYEMRNQIQDLQIAGHEHAMNIMHRLMQSLEERITLWEQRERDLNLQLRLLEQENERLRRRLNQRPPPQQPQQNPQPGAAQVPQQAAPLRRSTRTRNAPSRLIP